MAFFMDPGAMFLGCLGPSEQKFLVTLIETAAKSGYTRFVEPCAGTFAMANLAVQNWTLLRNMQRNSTGPGHSQSLRPRVLLLITVELMKAYARHRAKDTLEQW